MFSKLSATVAAARRAGRPPYDRPTDSAITVVHVITRLEFGGAQENTLYTCQRLDRDRFRVILAFGPGGLLDEMAANSDELPLWPIPELVREVRPTLDAQALNRMYRQLVDAREQHAALGLDPRRFIVHTHSSKAGIVGRFAAALAGVPTIVHGIHGFGFHPGQHPAKFTAFLNAERAAARVTDAFFSVSETSLREARARGIVLRRHRAEVIRSGMDLDQYRSTPYRRAETRRALDLPDDAEVVLTIANFKPQKDPLTLLEAFAHLAARRPKAILLFAGDGPLRPEVERAAEKLGARIRLLGWRTDVPDLLAACDVVALSSIFEGLPRSAVQAVASGRPFVGTNVDGTPEIIRHGKNGFLVPPKAPRPLANAIEQALVDRPTDPEDAKRLGAWDVRRMVEQQEAAYTELVSITP